MTLHLAPYVVRGEIENRRHNSTVGWIEIRGWDGPIHLELTGNPGPDLLGRRLRFTASEEPYGDFAPQDGEDLDLEQRQFGATGTFTAHHLMRVFRGEATAFHHRAKLGEPPPLEWKRRLYLEWFGNNGHIVLELPDPTLAFIEKEHGAEIELPLPPPEEPPFDPNTEALTFPLDPHTLHTPHLPKPSAEDSPGEFFRFQPIPSERPSLGDLDPDLAELEDLLLMDELIEEGGGMELGELLGHLPPSQSLSEDEAALLLKSLIAQLAAYRIVYHLCEHCDAREGYRILAEELAPTCRIQPELFDTEWVTHYDTADHCPTCQKAAEEEWQNLSPDYADEEATDGLFPLDADHDEEDADSPYGEFAFDDEDDDREDDDDAPPGPPRPPLH